MKYIMQFTDKDDRKLNALRAMKQIPELILVEDVYRKQLGRMHSGMITFLLSLKRAENEAHIHFEDDITLCKDFKQKADGYIRERPDMFIQFFTMRQSDVEKGSGVRPGGSFLMNQALYIPEGHSNRILAFYSEWVKRDNNEIENPTGFDVLIRDYLKENKLNYYVAVPSLIQHNEGRSLINPRRSSKRQSAWFIDEEGKHGKNLP